jgi:hypothetical protein
MVYVKVADAAAAVDAGLAQT